MKGLTMFQNVAPYTVAISKFHQGQNCRPVCVVYSGEVKGETLFSVSVKWIDDAGKTIHDALYSPTGDVTDCEIWLEQQGVRLDATGIHRNIH
jgi:hypothetical protein